MEHHELTQQKAGNRPRGRTLAEFFDKDGKLPVAERRLLDAAAAGEVGYIGSDQPLLGANESAVRPQFLRFLCLGGDEFAPVHEHGVLLKGALIDGDIDLHACRLSVPFVLVDCRVVGDVILRDADLVSVIFENTSTGRVIGDRLRCRGSIHFIDGLHEGGIALAGAQVTGNLDCQNGKMDGGSEEAFFGDGLRVRGGLRLSRGFSATGEVRLIGARIGGDLDCRGGRIENNLGKSLTLGRAVIGGNVFIGEDFRAVVEVDLTGAKIRGDIDCSGCHIDGRGVRAMTFDRAEISGAFIFYSAKFISGEISLLGVHVVTLLDRNKSYEQASALVLDGFRYDRIVGDAEVNPQSGIDWCRMQRPAHLTDHFKPHPWEQVIKLLREMGDEAGAREVAIEKQKQLRRAGKISGLPGLLHDAYGLFAGYGHRPFRLVRWFAAVWLVCSAVFHTAADFGVMAPTNALVYENPKYQICRPEFLGNWTSCQVPYEYTTFNSVLYSLDLILPLVDFQQEKDWAPMIVQPCETFWFGELCRRSWARAVEGGNPSALPTPGYWPIGLAIWVVMWIEILFGWIAGLLLAAVAAGLVKKD